MKAESASHLRYDHLVSACRKGDRRAMMEVYDRFHPMVYNSILRYVQEQVDAEDLMHDTFIRAFRKIGDLKEAERLPAWLKRMGVNKAIDFLRARIRMDELDEDIPEEHDEVEWPEAATVYAAMDELPLGYRTILRLYLIEDYNHEEIAEMLNISSATSRSQYVRAKQKLKQKLVHHA